ncbi:MAG: M48 family metalloprotease [Pseudomonadota bacterium]
MGTMLREAFVRTAAAVAAALALSVSNAAAQSLLRDAEIELMLREYSDPIFEAAGLTPEAVEIYLIGDPSLNAFVAGGLKMFVFTGLITEADTPNQVIGVIAHETGHMTGGHLARSDEAIAKASRPILLSLALGIGAIAAGAPEAGIGILGLGQSAAQANYLKYSRGQEASADQAAVTFLDATGQSSRGLLEFFQKLSSRRVISGYRINPYLQTHPLPAQRVTSLNQRAQRSPYWNRGDDPQSIEELRLVQAKIHGFLQDPETTMRLYPPENTSDAAEYARSIAYYRASQLDKALPAIDGLIAKYPDNPYYHELKGQMLFEHGEVEAAIAPHKRSTELAPTEPLLKVNVARALIATENAANVQAAVTQLRAAVRLEPENGFAWAEMARAYDMLGNDTMSFLATAEARYAYGAYGDAISFARRAQAGLDRGTTEWRQATDILAAAVSKASAAGAQRR